MVRRLLKRKTRKKVIIILILLCTAGLYIFFNTHITVINPPKTDAMLVNPMTGFAPCADNYDVVKPDYTLVYVDVTWRQLEPERGAYDFAGIEEANYLEHWRAQRKRVVFRFVCDIPEDEKHMDIPDWLYEETGGDGNWYDMDYGKGYSPNYANGIFIKRHREAIEALGAHYGKDDFFCYIELGSLGHWGEWHVKYDAGIKRMPLESIREQYIKPYLESFPNAMLLMRRPFNSAKKYNLGLYNDMTGLEDDTRDWLDWINNGGEYNQTGEEKALAAMPESWKAAPVGGEFTSDITMKQLLQDDINKTASLIAASHMSFIGPKVPVGSELQYDEGIKRVLSLLGYRLRIEKVVLTQSPFYNGLKAELSWVNDGYAPIYKNWPVNIYFFNASGEKVLQVPVSVDLTKVVDDTPIYSTTRLTVDNLPKGLYDICVAVVDPVSKQPAVEFAIKNKRQDKIYFLSQWKKK